MTPDDWDQRLSRLSTRWTLMIQAHGQQQDTVAQGEILRRYAGPVYRYLLGAVRDPEVAEDLAQEFALRFLRGDFRGAHPERGRFRHYLKTALVNLVNDHHRRRQAAPSPLPSDAADRHARDEEADQGFAAGWREELLERTWQALAKDNIGYHAALLLRVTNPDMPSPEIAERLTAQLNKPVSAALARKTIQRAQAKFAELLLDEVQGTLETPEDITVELKDLDLLRYCRGTLERRAAESAD